MRIGILVYIGTWTQSHSVKIVTKVNKFHRRHEVNFCDSTNYNIV